MRSNRHGVQSVSIGNGCRMSSSDVPSERYGFAWYSWNCRTWWRLWISGNSTSRRSESLCLPFRCLLSRSSVQNTDRWRRCGACRIHGYKWWCFPESTLVSASRRCSEYHWSVRRSKCPFLGTVSSCCFGTYSRYWAYSWVRGRTATLFLPRCWWWL